MTATWGVAVSVRNRHRVALELDIDEDPATSSRGMGSARPPGRAGGRSRPSSPHDPWTGARHGTGPPVGHAPGHRRGHRRGGPGVLDDLGHATCPQSVANRAPRPSIELLVELQAIAEQAERAAGQLREQGSNRRRTGPPSGRRAAVAHEERGQQVGERPVRDPQRLVHGHVLDRVLLPPAAVVATSVTRPARRWKNDRSRFQPMIPSRATIHRRRTSDPRPITRKRPTRAWPRPR